LHGWRRALRKLEWVSLTQIQS